LGGGLILWLAITGLLALKTRNLLQLMIQKSKNSADPYEEIIINELGGEKIA
jgi:hypothetical protein